MQVDQAYRQHMHKVKEQVSEKQKSSRAKVQCFSRLKQTILMNKFQLEKIVRVCL